MIESGCKTTASVQTKQQPFEKSMLSKLSLETNIAADLYDYDNMNHHYDQLLFDKLAKDRLFNTTNTDESESVKVKGFLYTYFGFTENTNKMNQFLDMVTD